MKHIGILLFTDVEELDAVGPWEVLAAWTQTHPEDGWAVQMLSKGGGPVRCAKGLMVGAHASLEDAPAGRAAPPRRSGHPPAGRGRGAPDLGARPARDRPADDERVHRLAGLRRSRARGRPGPHRRQRTGHVRRLCVNAFQTQPEDRGFWDDEHTDLLLKKDGEVVEDKNWPGELVLDTSTAKGRAELMTVLRGWVDECVDRGYQAVEPDILDSYDRSEGALTEADNMAVTRELASYAHGRELAIVQKHASELGSRSWSTPVRWPGSATRWSERC